MSDNPTFAGVPGVGYLCRGNGRFASAEFSVSICDLTLSETAQEKSKETFSRTPLTILRLLRALKTIFEEQLSVSSLTIPIARGGSYGRGHLYLVILLVWSYHTGVI